MLQIIFKRQDVCEYAHNHYSDGQWHSYIKLLQATKTSFANTTTKFLVSLASTGRNVSSVPPQSSNETFVMG